MTFYFIRLIPSHTSSGRSMATSLLVSLKSGAVYLVDQAFSICQETTFFITSSSSVMTTVLRVLCHSE